MPNLDPLDAAIDGLDQAAPQPRDATPDPLDAAIDGVTQDNARLRTSLYGAVKQNPDEVARATQLARQTGLPTPIVQRNLQTVQQRATLDRAEQMRIDTPALARQMENPDFAAIAHDDGTLSRIETVLKNSGRALASGIPGFNEGMWGVAQSGADVVSKYITGPLTGTVLPEDPAARAADYFNRQRLASKATRDAWMPKAEGNLASGWYSGLQSLSQNMITLPVAALSGNPSLALAPMTATTGGQAYGQARDKGVDVPNSLTFAASQAAIEYATEKLPVSWLLRDLKAGASFGKTLAHQAVSEVPGEQVATVLQDLNEWAVLNPDKPFSEYVKERPDAAIQTLVATLVGTGGQVGTVKLVDRVAQHVMGRQDAATATADAGNALRELATLAKDSKLRRRDTEAFAQHVQASADAGGRVPSSVFIDAATLANSLAQSGADVDALKANMPSLAQLDTAVATQGQVEIPVGEFAAHLTGREYSDTLLQNLRMDPEAPTIAEANAYLQGEDAPRLNEEINRLVSEHLAETPAALEESAIRASIAEQLNQVGRFSPEVNASYADLHAAFFTTMAERLGTTLRSFSSSTGRTSRAKRFPARRASIKRRPVSSTACCNGSSPTHRPPTPRAMAIAIAARLCPRSTRSTGGP